MPRLALDDGKKFEDDGGKKKPVDQSKFLPVDDVADTLGVSIQSVYNWTKQNKLHPVKVNGRLRFNPQEVEALIEQKTGQIRAGAPTRAQKILQDIPVKLDAKRSPPQKKPAEKSAEKSPATDREFGEISAEATKMFCTGQGVVEVVVALKVPFATAGQIFDDYKTYSHAVHFDSKTVSMLRQRLNWSENPPTIGGFVKALNEWEAHVIESVKREQRAKSIPTEPSAATDEKKPPETPTAKPEQAVERVIPPEVIAGLDFNE